MKETILLFGFDKEKQIKVKRALLPLQMKVKVVEPEEYLQPVGYVAGNKEIEPKEPEEHTEAPVLDQEMMVMAWVRSQQIDQILLALRKQGVGRINYKAVITSQNQYWDCVTLYEELKKEHQMYMEQNANRSGE